MQDSRWTPKKGLWKQWDIKSFDLMNPFIDERQTRGGRLNENELSLHPDALAGLKLLNQWLTIANKIKFNFGGGRWNEVKISFEKGKSWKTKEMKMKLIIYCLFFSILCF